MQQEFAPYRERSVQDFRFVLSGQVQKEIFYGSFVKNIENHIKSKAIVNTLKWLIQQQTGYL